MTLHVQRHTESFTGDENEEKIDLRLCRIAKLTPPFLNFSPRLSVPNSADRGPN